MQLLINVTHSQSLCIYNAIISYHFQVAVKMIQYNEHISILFAVVMGELYSIEFYLNIDGEK